MPSRAYTSFLRPPSGLLFFTQSRCQCPLGLIPHFYEDMNNVKSYAMIPCQCPLGLIPHFYDDISVDKMIEILVSMPSRAYTSFLLKNLVAYFTTGEAGVNALSGLYLISTVPLQKPRFYAVSRACFCSHLSEYSGNSRFPCMLTFWTYLMRYTYP